VARDVLLIEQHYRGATRLAAGAVGVLGLRLGVAGAVVGVEAAMTLLPPNVVRKQSNGAYSVIRSVTSAAARLRS
jgi:hypothetical protein